jgi:uncharacterized protein
MTTQHPRRDRAINYVEFNVADIDRAKVFYGGAFGWTFTDYGPDYCEFTDGHMTGGFSKGEVTPLGGPLVVLYGENLDELMTRVKSSGGKVTKSIFDFPGGQRFHFTDPDGYELAIWTVV